jgi:hypothetical protein
MEPKILYNVTVKILKDHSEEWLKWMTEIHIPDVMATGKFTEYKISEIIEEENEGRTFAIQYVSSSMATFQSYQKEDAKALQKDHTDRYKDKYVAFRTLMSIIKEG